MYVECAELGAACQRALRETVAVPLAGGRQPKVLFERNSAAGWGSDLATAPSRIAFAAAAAEWCGGAGGAGCVPGVDGVAASLALLDSLGSGVRGADRVVRVRVCASAADGGCEADAASLVTPPPRIPARHKYNHRPLARFFCLVHFFSHNDRSK